MITIKAPERYINEPDILKSAGEYISKLGTNALIVGGKTALKSVGEDFFSSIQRSGIKFRIEEFEGYCTEKNINKFTSIVKETDVDLIIGVGGGRVLDSIKVVGERSNIVIVTVPTIAATCAAWSALSVIYDESGKVIDFNILNTSPKLVLADTKIIANAPVRYFNAGIGDTIVKWYEAAPHFIEGNNDISLRIGLQTAKLALDILYNSSVSAAEEIEKNNVSKEVREVIDAIIILAGLVGSINGGNHRAAIAHAIHNSLTAIPETHESLHGEKVIFGLIVQFVLEGKPEKEIEELITFLNSLDLPVTLEQLGIKEKVSEKISYIANRVNIKAEDLDKLSFDVNSQLIEQAIIKADQFGRSSLGSNQIRHIVQV